MSLTDHHTIEIKDYDHEGDEVTCEIHLSSVGSALETDSLAFLLNDVTRACNIIGFTDGRKVGRSLREAHLATQASLIDLLLGILVGLGENDVIIDGRNRRAVEMCKKIEVLLFIDPRFDHLLPLLKQVRRTYEYQNDPYISRPGE